MNFLENLMAGGSDYRVTTDLGGAVFAPAVDGEDGLRRFAAVADKIIANDGLGYSVHLTHKNSDHGYGWVDRIIINFRR